MNSEAKPFRGIPYAYNTSLNQTFSAYTDNRHLISFGPTRSGKGTTVIVPALLLAGHSILCIDPKGQNAAITARRRRELGQAVHFLNPFDELGLGTSRFNPLSHLRIEDRNVVADVASLSEALILDDGKDSHWSNSARGLVRALLLHLIATQPGRATLAELRRLITLPVALPQGETFAHVIGAMLQSSWPFIRQPAGRFINIESREIASILSTAITQTDFLDDPNIAGVLSGSDFAMLDLKAKPTTVFLILPGRYMEAYGRFFRLLITSAIDQLTSRVGGYPVLILLDEFASLQNLAAVSKAFGFAAGYNVQLWPFLQDLPQLQAIYGDRWESFLANAGLVQFFTPSDLTTAEYIERRAGKATREKVRETHSEISKEQANRGFTGVSKSFDGELAPLMPVELVFRAYTDEAQIVFFGGVQGPHIGRRLPYYKNPRLQGFYDTDPFHAEG
jgi:type IV secretion system protein VirD4